MKQRRTMKSYIIRRVLLIVAVMCIAAGTLWAQGGISERDLAKLAQDPAGMLSFPVRDLRIQTQSGKTIDLKVEVAATPEHWAQGLMFRTELADDAGMIFDMGQPPRVISFWMRNTLIPLDMVFIGDDGIVKHIHKNAQPKDDTSISSVEPVTMVLEIGGGRSDALGLAVGDKVVFGGI